MPALKRKSPPLVHETQAFDLGASGSLRLVVVADTHSNPDPRSSPLIAALRPDRILHAGDIGARRVLDDLAVHAPVTAVRGNIDAQMPGVPDVVTIDVQEEGRTLLTILLLHIAVYGPKLRADAARLARAAGATLVACGHSHVPFLGQDRGIAVVNAGSIGPRRFQLPIVFAVVDVRREGVSMHHVSCETGERWRPVPSAIP
ncbi:MAG TPA: metallophosphoesterase family protein [Polyangiaceae bacterium]